jgi:prevent-host-death family protein
MAAREVAITEFRRRATEFVRLVEKTRQPVRITRHGVAVAELRPVSNAADELLGSVTFLDDKLTAPTLDPSDWELAKRSLDSAAGPPAERLRGLPPSRDTDLRRQRARWGSSPRGTRARNAMPTQTALIEMARRCALELAQPPADAAP